MSNKIAIIFICHDNNSISKIIEKNKYIIFVGDQEISNEYKDYPKLIIARDLPNNIEKEKRLLTFTAWYAIVKNNLFTDYTYLCILEYDVLLNNFFEENLNNLINNSDSNLVNVSFIMHYNNLFIYDIDKNILTEFLKLKNIDVNIIDEINTWGSTTNQCIRRDILTDFVDWYYLSYIYIKTNHYKKLPYYHERLYMIYLKNKNYKNEYLIDNLIHHQSFSHIYYS